MKFKLLIGQHVDHKNRLYNPGDVIETTTDLNRFNANTNMPKFERLMEESIDYAIQPAPGETQEEFERRKQRLAGQQSVAAAAAKAGFDTIHGNKPTTATVTLPNLETMSLKQLQEFAAEEEIDLKGAVKREDIIKLIKGKST